MNPLRKKDAARKSVAIAIVLLLWILIPSPNTFFVTLFLIWWGFRLDVHILFGVALGFLVILGIASSFFSEESSDLVARYVYLLLIIGASLRVLTIAPSVKANERREAVVLLDGGKTKGKSVEKASRKGDVAPVILKKRTRT